MISTQILAKLIALAGGWASTGYATYIRLGIGSLEAKVLCAIGPKAYTASEISRSLDIDRSATSRAVGTLLTGGFVIKIGGRGGLLSLTAEGCELQRKAAALGAERERRLRRHMSPAEVAILLGYLDRLTTNLPELQNFAEEFGRSMRAKLEHEGKDGALFIPSDARRQDRGDG